MNTPPPSGTENRGRRSGTRWNIRMRKTSGLRTQGMGATAHGRCINVSHSGILFQSSAPYTVGDMLDMEICLSEHASVRCLVRIQRIRPAVTKSPAYGAEFVRFYDKDDKVFQEYVRKLHQWEAREGQAHTLPASSAGRAGIPQAAARSGSAFFGRFFRR